MIKVYSVGPKKREPSEWVKGATRLLTILVGFGGVAAYDRAFLEEKDEQAIVTTPVKSTLFRWEDFLINDEKWKTGVVELELITGEMSGEKGAAYFTLKSAGKNYSEGDILDVSYRVRRLTGKVIMDNLRTSSQLEGEHNQDNNQTINKKPQQGA